MEIAYNEGQAPLEELLQSIDRPGDYCTQGRLFVPMPRVEVASAGVLSFPVTPPHAQALISVADRAPYGRGEQTLVDSSVRACWQIDAAQVTVTGAVWRDTLMDIVARAATGLGCPPEHTEARLVWLLEHDYSEAGLSFHGLKNADAAVGGALSRAAQRAGHSLHAAILHLEEYGIANESSGVPYGVDPHDLDWKMEEVFDSEIWLDGWVAPDGTKRDYGRVPVLPGELLPDGALDDAEPDDQRVNVTGNEGVELSHSYRRAALVVWPLRQTVRTLAHGGIGGALAYVADELARTDEATGHARALVAQLVDSWPAPVRSYQYRPSEPPDAAGSCTDSLRLLRRLGDEATTRRFLHEILTAHYSGEENAELLETAATLSPVTLHAHLAR